MKLKNGIQKIVIRKSPRKLLVKQLPHPIGDSGELENNEHTDQLNE